MTQVSIRAGALLAIVMTALNAPAAMAQNASQDCTCLLPARAANGTVTSATGAVLVNGTQGQGQAAPGTRIGLGSEVTTGPGSQAQIDIAPDCQPTVADRETLTVEPFEGNQACVRVTRNDPGPIPTQAGAGGSLDVLGYAFIGAVGVGGALSLGDDDDDNNNAGGGVTPPTPPVPPLPPISR